MLIRLCLCIPTYNNPLTIEKVVEDCLASTSFPLVVVDDGSDRAVRDLLASQLCCDALSSGRLSVLRLDSNRGKGAALQHAFQWAVVEGYTHLLTLDGDGQHLGSEISKFKKLVEEHPWDLIIGCRNLVGENVPGISKFGRKFSNFWVKYQTGHGIRDSQSGFRLYPLFQVQNMRFRTRRYDFEIEVLIRLLWKNVKLREVDIDVLYPREDLRVSHFDKLWDNVRISILNTLLVVVSLLKNHNKPREAALSVAVGVVVGCTPFFGLHTLMILALAPLLRLNFALMFVGTQVSLPPLAPFVIMASLGVGRKLWGAPSGSSIEFHHGLKALADSAAQDLGRWLAGSLVIGVTLGLLTGFAVYLSAQKFQKLRQQSHKPANWNGRSRGGRLGNGFMKLVTKYTGLRAAYFCLGFIVPYFYIFAPRARRASNEYWKILRPQTAWLSRQTLVMKHFYRFAQLLLDRVYQSFSTAKPSFVQRSNGLEHIREPRPSEQGLILVSAHVGAWDMASVSIGRKALSDDLHRVEYVGSPTFLSAEIGLKTLASNDPNQPILNVREELSRGKVVALMADRPMLNHFELVTFFGKLAAFDATPFRIAAACRARVVLTFGFKGQGREYLFFASPPREYAFHDRSPRDLQCRQWIQDFARELEAKVSQYPEQWLNFFSFWSSIPAPPPGVKGSRERNRLEQELNTPREPRPVSATATKTIVAPEPRR